LQYNQNQRKKSAYSYQPC